MTHSQSFMRASSDTGGSILARSADAVALSLVVQAMERTAGEGLTTFMRLQPAALQKDYDQTVLKLKEHLERDRLHQGASAHAVTEEDDED